MNAEDTKFLHDFFEKEFGKDHEQPHIKAGRNLFSDAEMDARLQEFVDIVNDVHLCDGDTQGYIPNMTYYHFHKDKKVERNIGSIILKHMPDGKIEKSTYEYMYRMGRKVTAKSSVHLFPMVTYVAMHVQGLYRWEDTDESGVQEAIAIHGRSMDGRQNLCVIPTVMENGFLVRDKSAKQRFFGVDEAKTVGFHNMVSPFYSGVFSEMKEQIANDKGIFKEVRDILRK